MSSSTTDPQTTVVDVTMPQMGVSVAEGTLVEWKKQVGDWVEADETICDISTDKIDTEVPAPASGRVTEILVAVEQTVAVGTPLARIATDAKPGEAHASEHVRHYSPVVQRIAAEHDIDLSKVEGTGRGGRVRKQDVLALVEEDGAKPLHTESPYRPEEPAAEPVPAPAAPAGDGLSRMRRTIGEHMKRSLDTAATCTSWAEADMSAVEAARARLGITALPIVARCVIDALREHPSLNATLDGDAYTRHTDVNLGIAVSLGEDGLIVPVIHRAHELSAEGLASRIKDLAKRARNGDLSNEEVRGGTFTITNPGQYGTLAATPVINQPQVAILDLEAIVKRVVVTGEDAMAIRPMTILGLSWDHRALDGVAAARFLGAVRERLQGWC